MGGCRSDRRSAASSFSRVEFRLWRLTRHFGFGLVRGAARRGGPGSRIVNTSIDIKHAGRRSPRSRPSSPQSTSPGHAGSAALAVPAPCPPRLRAGPRFGEAAGEWEQRSFISRGRERASPNTFVRAHKNAILLAPEPRRMSALRDRSPRCFNGLPYHCGFPQVKIVCQQIWGIPFTILRSRKRVTRRHRLGLQTALEQQDARI